MKSTKITYWASTAIVALMMLFSGYSYFTSPMAIDGFKHVGFPDFFRVELGVAKLLGALALILPFVPRMVKEFAYVGFTITFVSASVAHFSVGDPAFNGLMPLIFLLILALSYFSYAKLKKA